MPVEVRISSKHRSLSIPAGTKELVDNVLEKAGLGEVVFEMCGGPRVHATPHTKGVRVGRVKGHSVVLTVQPGNNTTRSRYHLYVPKDLDPEEVREHLLSASGVEVATDDKEEVMPNGYGETMVVLPDPADVRVEGDCATPPQPAPVKNLRGFMRQLDTPDGDIGVVMLAVHERWGIDGRFGGRECGMLIGDTCQLDGCSPKSLDAMVGCLASRGYLERVDAPAGKGCLYKIGPKGRQALVEIGGLELTTVKSDLVGTDGLREVLARMDDLGQKAERFCAALAAREAIAREREALQFRLEELQFEEEEAAATLSDPEFQTAARKVQEIGGFL